MERVLKSGQVHRALVPAALLFLAACGDSGRSRDLNGTPLDITIRPVDAGGLPSDDPDAGPGLGNGDGGALGPDGGAGTSDAGGPRCGDGILDEGEDCDGVVPQGPSCVAIGFDQGAYTCNLDCTWNTDACSGTENCFDARDNDGDGTADCADSADCATACSDACLSAPELSENALVSGDTTGHSSNLGSFCSGVELNGSEVAYQVDITEDARFDVLLGSAQNLGLSVRSACTQAPTELECSHRPTRLTLEALQGERYFIVVHGASASDFGSYTLELAARQRACGDSIRDSDEACDDGNINDGDGCDPECNVEASESEPNGIVGFADVFDFSPWAAEVSPAGDVDIYQVDLVATSSTLVVDTLNLADGACGLNLMDTVVDILDTDANANAVLASDDDSGDGACAQAVASGLPPGTYYVQIAAAASAEPATFPYRLEVSVGVCGDGDVTLGEECDDQNLVAGDGCDPTCKEES